GTSSGPAMPGSRASAAAPPGAGVGVADGRVCRRRIEVGSGRRVEPRRLHSAQSAKGGAEAARDVGVAVGDGALELGSALRGEEALVVLEVWEVRTGSNALPVSSEVLFEGADD